MTPWVEDTTLASDAAGSGILQIGATLIDTAQGLGDEEPTWILTEDDVR